MTQKQSRAGSGPLRGRETRCSDFVGVLRAVVRRRADQTALIFLDDGEVEFPPLSYGELERRVRAVAARLRTVAEPGDRALLLYPPGAGFVIAFLGCLYAGVVAVPTFPPRRGREDRRLGGIVEDARPSVVLTESALAAAMPAGARVLATDGIDIADAERWRPSELSAETPAFLQYTSGSTAAPKGVVVTHGNLVHNQEIIREVCAHDEESVTVSWLPPYHDMGLIAGILQPLFTGGRCVLMSPAAFLQKPVRWLDAITRYRAATSGGPNFAYDLCVRKVSAGDRERLDLASWRMAFNGAEPVRADTIERFARVFARCGFDRGASYPCYGLAEATLYVTGGGRGEEPTVEWFDPDALERHQAAPVSGTRERILVGCGRPRMGQQLRIVDPESRTERPPDGIGEIWVAGPSVAPGYWHKPEQTAHDFGARLADDQTTGPFLRTGDLGFLWDGELFVTGRLKDLIIIRGRNHYPQDLELTAGQAHPALRAGGGAAFSVDVDAEERLVVVHELRRGVEPDFDEVSDAVRRALSEEHEVHAHELVLISAGRLPKTSSGKVQRHACRAAFQAGELAVVGSSRAPAPAAVSTPVLRRDQLLSLPAPERSAPLLEYLRGRLAAATGRDRIDPEQPLTALGLDSLRAVELASAIEEDLGTGPSQARLLAGATLRDLAGELIAALESETERSPIPPAPQADRHPLSAGQRSLWLVEELHPHTTAYALRGALRFEDEIDAARLQQALDRLVARQPALRTTIDVAGGEPYQVIHDAIADDSLFRVELEDDGRLLRLRIHHLVSDLWSIGVLLEELDALYRDPAAELPPLPVRYVDYVHWQAVQPQGELAAYWQDALREPTPLNLPSDRPRPATPTMAGGLVFSHCDGKLVAAVDALGPTRFMTLAAAFQVLLHRHTVMFERVSGATGQDDVLLGIPTTGRNRPELHGVIGYFVNPVVLRGDLAGDPPFEAFLDATRRKVLEAFAHQDYPFPLLRLTFEAMLVYQQTRDPRLAAASLGAAGAELELFGQRCETVALPCRDAQFELMLYAAPAGEPAADGLALALEYAAELFDAATMRRLLGHFRVLLRSVAEDSGRRLSELPLLAAAERAQLVREWNDVGSDRRPACLHELVTAQVRRTPRSVALVCGRSGRTLSYRQLERRSAAVAARLRALGVGAEVRVGVCMPRTPELVVALLGVLRAGGTYVPIDPDYPVERQAFMLADSAARVLISDSGLAGRLPAGARVLYLDELPRRAPAGANRGVRVDPESLSHLIYTSGSTGVPKGVAIRHAAAVAMVRWSLHRYRPEELRGVLLSTSICFDISVFEIFVPLACGGAVIVAENALELPALAVRGQVTLINTVPSAMTELVRQDAVPPSVRTVNLAGEPLKRELVDAVYATGTVERVYNLYGPSEDTTYTTWAEVPRRGKVSIGRPLAGTRAFVLGPTGRPVPMGVPGELCVAGSGLARGYLGRPALSAARFVPNPLSGDPWDRGARLYRTGDLVRYLPGGEIDFLGRLDHQVKVRGFRIELGEIESVLLRHDRVRECVAVVREDPKRGSVLVAYVAGDEARSEPLAAYLREQLPEAMVPAAFVVLEKLPLLPNGKVDRGALPAPDWTVVPRAYAAPRTPVEELLAGIWSEVLGTDRRIGIHDDFFALGGHSLVATRVLSRVSEAFGVELPVRTLFAAPTLAALAPRIEAASEAAPRRLPPPERVGREGPLPLSPAQQRLWFLSQLEPDSAYYNLAAAGRLRGALAVGPWRRAVGEIVRRHEALRTTFVQEAGDPVQVIAAPSEPAMPVVDLTALTPPGRERVLSRLLQVEARRPFDLGRGPLLRVGLVKITPEDHGVWLSMHHIISDGWSLGVFFRELSVLYESFAAGRPSPLSELAVQYADFTSWQRRILDEEVLASELGYWRRKLAGAPALLELGADRPRPAVQSLAGATCELRLPAELVTALRELGRRRGVTLFMTLLSGFQLLLSRYSGQDDVVVGFPVANRNRIEIEPLVGFFVNTLVLRTDLSGNPMFSQLLTRVRGELLDAWAHQEVPFERLVEELAPERNLAYTPLFQVVLGLQNAPWEVPRLRGPEFQPRAVDTGTSRFDLTLLLEERGEALAGTLEYSTALFDRTTVRRLLGHFRNLLSAAAAEPDEQAAELSLMSAGERAQLLMEWLDTRRPYPREATVRTLFEDQAARTPEAVAVGFGGEQLSYRELNGRANRLAHHLRTLGVGPEAAVAVFMERSVEMVVAILAVTKAGGFYLPLDTGYPPERLAFMLDDVGVGVLLAHQRLLGSLPDHAARVVCVDRESTAGAPRAGENPPPRGTAENLCYVMHTSGSTGRPKGVAVTHRAVVRLVRDNDFAALGAGEVFLQFAPISFDAATLEVWGALLNGGRLVVYPPGIPALEELGEEIERRRVSTLWLTAGLFHQMVEAHLPRLRPLRQLLAGGDVLSVPHVRKVLRELPSVRLINGYGPTENTTFTCCQALAPADAERPSVPIGRPIAQTAVQLVDRGLGPVPIGVPGELWITGDGLARGYFARPGLTAARFVPDPTGRGRAYRTGDLARWLPDGRIEFLGRIDTQVKVRGVRIELGEIEVLLREHPWVRNAVVVVHGEGAEQKRLVAYVVEETEVQPDELREMLRARVPEHMVPAAFMMLDELPLSPTGKVDRRALPAPQWEGERAGYTPPRTPVEELLAGIWAEVLGLDRIGIDDEFFELGGHSLLATRMISRIRWTLGVELALKDSFVTPVLRDLAAVVTAAREQGQSPAPPILALPRGRVFPLSFAQERLWLLEQLDPGTATYNVCGGVLLRGEIELGRLAGTFARIVRRHETLRTTFAQGAQGPQQVTARHLDLPLPLVDLGRLAPGARQAEARRQASVVARQPFDLSRGPLLRVVVLRLEVDPRMRAEHLVILNLHHIISDGWSVGVLAAELGALYAGRELAHPAVQYADFAVWQRRWFAEGDVLSADLDYWRRRLDGVPAVLELPADRPRPPVISYRGGAVPVRLSAERIEALDELGRRRGATRFMTLLAAFQTLLGRYAGRHDVAVGCPIAGRTRVEIEPLIGFFVNTLVLRGDLSGDPPFAALLNQVRESALDAWTHQNLPFERLVEALRPTRSLVYSPLFQIVFALQNTPQQKLRLPGIEARPTAVETGITRFDLELLLSADAEGVSGQLRYCRDLFDDTTVRRLRDHLERLLAAVTQDPGRRLSQLPLLSAAERSQLLREWNDTATAEPEPGCVLRALARRAAHTPAALAVSGAGEALDYGELDRRANRIAHALQAAGVGPEVVVGILIERSPLMVAAVLAAVKAGGAYLPMDPTSPPERLAFMLADSGAALLLTRHDLRDRLRELTVPALCLDREELPATDRPPPSGVGPENLAYVIYTSGSTGRPKGTELRHAGLVNLVRGHRRAFQITAADRATLVAGPGFDASVAELWPYLIAGASLHVPDPEVVADPESLVRWLAANRITISFLPTPLAEAVLTVPWPESTALRLLLTGGDQLRQRPAPHLPFTLINNYGPTENTVATTWTPVAPEGRAGGLPPIGRPLPNTGIYLLDSRLEPVPLGAAGELSIGGRGLARGYRRHPRLTAAAFVPNPFAARAGRRLYRTGDLVRYRTDGEIVFLGRIDRQVKIRGFRIEPGEIEKALVRHDAVREAVVVAGERAAETGGRGELRLVAFVVPAQPGTSAVPSLAEFLRRSLPDHMVPAIFVELPALPLNASGKVDRKSLDARAAAAELVRDAPVELLPRSALERTLAELWQDVLGVPEVGLRDNFFDLGGHSLLLPRVQAGLRERLGCELPLVELFRHPTVSALAAHLGGEEALRVEASTAAHTEPLAVIGISGRFPGAECPDQLWRNLCAGVESIRRLSREELLAAGVDPEVAADPRYVPVTRYLAGIETFDAAFFGLSPREAEILDPQQRLFLECAWEALERAGYDPGTCRGRIGVYAGAGNNFYGMHLLSNPGVRAAHDVTVLQHSVYNDHLATRVSYKLNLRGPAVVVQTACSSSLVAIHMARQALLLGECDLALAGGVSLLDLEPGGYQYAEGGVLSPDGHCRAFDAAARGAVGGDGAGVVVLKRLSAARRDHDLIHAVLLGSAINNDGSLKVGYTAPSVEGQAEVIRAAVTAAGIDPETISYVEAHGTGTPLGDPVEVAALSRAFGTGPRGRSPCFLGSIKTNIGHLDAAAGVAGFIKTVLALEHGELPPNLHFSTPNPEIDFANSPFRVVTELRPWSGEGIPRRAGVSSFGIGGTNAHAVLEEPPMPPASGPSRPWQLLVLAARTATALETLTTNLTAHLEQHPLPLADVAFTLHRRCTTFPHRRMVVGRDRADVFTALRNRDGGRIGDDVAGQGHRPVVFLFPGQGAQYVGMGRELYENEGVFRAAVDRSSELLQPHLAADFDIRHALYPPAEQLAEAEEMLGRTWLTQPALFTIEYALAQQWIAWGVEPEFMIGHSIGEYVAACLAGVFTLEEALLLVAARGRLIQSLPPGAMLSVRRPASEIEPLLDPPLSLAAVNGPDQCVVSGPQALVEACREALAERGVKTRLLHTSHAFHSAMMEPVLPRFRDALAQVRLRPPQRPYLSNVTGTRIRPDEATDPAYWVAQLRRTVRFAHSVGEVLKEPGAVFLEVGPGRTLTSLIRRQAPSATLLLPSLRHPQQDGSDQALLITTLGRLWLAGVQPDWSALYRDELRRCVPLPTYPFERRRFWVEPGAALPLAAGRRAARTAEVPDAGGDEKPEDAPPPRHQRPSLQSPFVAPRDEMERRLAEIWQGLFGFAEVGIYDNFFELGGDSISALQIVVRAEQAGLRMTTQQLLSLQTIAELAPVVERVGEPIRDPGAGTDPVVLSPIQHWFFEQDLPASHHFNQTLFLEVREPPVPPLLERAFRQLTDQHDALRLRFRRQGSEWRQVVAAPGPPSPLVIVDLSAVSEHDQADLLGRAGTAVQAGLDLEQGPMVRLALFDLGAERSQRLLLTAHQLAVDPRSWPIILDDLWAFYTTLTRDRPAAEPIKASSFRDWVTGLADSLSPESLTEESAYWLDPSRERAARLPVDLAPDRAANTAASAGTVTQTLDEDATRALLRHVADVYKTRTGEVLLAALVMAVGEWTQERLLVVDVQAPCRDAPRAGMDLSRTVGWLMTIYPMLFDVGDLSDPGQVLARVKEDCRRLPREGIGYGLLRYSGIDRSISERLGALPPAEILFSYLGETAPAALCGPLTPAPEFPGPSRDPRCRRCHLLELTSSIRHGRLLTQWTFSHAVHHRETIERLSAAFLQALDALIDHCRSLDARHYTPSDFPEADLDENELGQLLAELAE